MVLEIKPRQVAHIDVPARLPQSVLKATATGARVRMDVQKSADRQSWSSPIVSAWLEEGVETNIAFALEEPDRGIRVTLAVAHVGASVELSLDEPVDRTPAPLEAV